MEAILDPKNIYYLAIIGASFLAFLIIINTELRWIKIIFALAFPLSLLYIFVWNILKYLFRKREKSFSGNVQQTDTNFVFTLDRGGSQVEVANPFRGVLIMGGAGSGKTASLITPILQNAIWKGFTGIVYDFKCPDLTNLVYDFASKNKKKVHFYFLNFTDLSRTHQVNPLANIEESAHARELATALISNLLPESIARPDFFSRSAIALLTGAIWYLHEEHPEACTVPHVISLLLWENPEQLIEKICENELARDMVASVKSGLTSEKQTAGVISTLQISLSTLSNKKLFYVLSGQDFTLDINNPSHPKFLCIGNNPGVSDTLSPVISLVMTAALKQMNRPGMQKSVVLLDEAPTLYIPNFDQIPATARSNQVATVFCAQDYSQLEDKYGSTKAEVILSNLANQFWGKTTNPKTAEKVIKLFGKQDKTFTTASSGTSTHGLIKSSRNKSVSETIQERDRVTMLDIRDLHPGQFYASLVETQKNEWKGLMDFQATDQNQLPPFSNPDNEELDRAFRQIKEDIKQIFS